MKHLGDFDTSAVIYGMFTTYSPSTGAPAALGGGSGPAVVVYKDGSAAQSSAGVTLTPSFDGIAGLNHVAIDTSADGTFYSSGGHFEIVVANGTVAGVEIVGACVASFDLRKSSSLKTGTNSGAVSFTGGMTVSNAAGDALTLSSGGGNGNGLTASGAGTGDGIQTSGGATGRGLHARGGATSGAAILAEARGGNSEGIAATGLGSSDGIMSTGGATGRGIHAVGGATSGAGFRAEGTAGNANGLECVAQGSGTDLAADNIATNAQATAIQAKTDNLPTDPADESLIIAATDAIMTRLGAPAGASVSADVAAVLASVALRLLTSAYTAPLDAAGTRAAVGLATANLDTQLGTLATAAALSTVAGYIDTEVAAIKAKTDQLTFGATNAVNANITHVIADPVQANGSTTTNWGGAP